MKNQTLFISLVFMVTIFCSCSATKHAQKQERKVVKRVTKAYNINPAIVAELTRNWFPCVPLNADTVTHIDTGYIEIPCPVKEALDLGYEDGSTTTSPPAPAQQIKYVRIPVEGKTITITRIIEDSAKIKTIQNEYETRLKSKDKELSTLSKSNKKIKTWRDIFLGGSLFALLLIIAAIAYLAKRK